MKIIWNYMFRALNEIYWNNKIRCIPTFLNSLEGDMLGDFLHTPTGINSIHLADNQGLTQQQMTGVLLHEMCHQSVFQKHGCEVDGHGKEWQDEMKFVGFVGEINEYTDGLNRFNDTDMTSMLKIYNRIILLSKDEEC